MVKVLITQPYNKQHLVQAFKDAGAEVINTKGTDIKPDLIIPVVDEELPTIAYLRNQLPVVCSSEYTISMTRDKAEFNRFCNRHGFLTPRTMQELVVAKPRFGKGSKGVLYLDRSYILQEDMSELPEVSVDYFADRSGNVLSVIPRFRRNVVNGESQEAEFIEDMDLTEVTRMGQELGIIGPAVIQGFYTKTQFYFTEINCRYGGGSWLSFGKFDSPRWLVENHAQFNVK